MGRDTWQSLSPMAIPIDIFYRPLKDSDADQFLVAVRQSSERLSRWLDTPSRIQTIEEAQAAVRELRPSGQRSRFGAFAGNEIAASAKVIETAEDGPLEIGVWTSSKWTGHRLGRSLVTFVVDTLAASVISTGDEVVLRHEIGNKLSQKMILSLLPDRGPTMDTVGPHGGLQLAYWINFSQWRVNRRRLLIEDPQASVWL